MPQLDPSPWLMTMVFSWVIFIFIVPAKVLKHKHLYNPNLMDFNTLQNKLWFWPW